MHVLLDNEKVAEILLIGWGDEVIELGGILVSGHLGHLAEDLHLSDDLFALIDGSEDVFQELDGNNGTGCSVLSLNDFAIASNSEEFDELVLLEGILPDWGESDHLLSGVSAFSGTVGKGRGTSDTGVIDVILELVLVLAVRSLINLHLEKLIFIIEFKFFIN